MVNRIELRTSADKINHIKIKSENEGLNDLLKLKKRIEALSAVKKMFS